MSYITRVVGTVCAALSAALILMAQSATQNGPPPDFLPAKFVHPVGDAASGREVFRFETFNNQAFWSTAAQLPQGIVEARVTPLQALQLGLNINADALNEATKLTISQALQQVQNGTVPASTALGNPDVTLSLLNQNAVIGLVAFGADNVRKPLGNTGTFNVNGGDKLGISCAVCHGISDNSILAPNPQLGIRGSIGRPDDGRTNHGLDFGGIIALARRSLAYYPFLQVKFDVLNGATAGRGFAGLSTNATSMPTEAQADLYLTGSGPSGRFYPVGSFDDTGDGNGNPLHISPLFRTDLAAPWGSDGGIEMMQNFSNNVYTVALDPTSLVTPNGRQFLHTIAGKIGDELADDYELVLRNIGVIGTNQALSEVVPFVVATSETPGTQRTDAGRRVDEKKLIDMNAYTNSLPAPPAPAGVNRALAAQGREIFRGSGNCTSCHQVNPAMFVPPVVTPMEVMYPGYSPMVVLSRMRPLSDIQNSDGPSPLFDDKLIVVDATRANRGEVRGIVPPLLLDLPRKPALLHDDSVTGSTFDLMADSLLNPSRGSLSAHPFYLASATDRRAVVEFLKGLEIRPAGTMSAVSSATFAGTELARDSIVTIFGTQLATATQLAPGGALPALLAGTTVDVTDSSGVTRPAGLIYVSSSQINLIVPAATSVGTAAVTITSADGAVTSAPVQIVLVRPGLFSANSTGSGVAAASVMRRRGGADTIGPAFQLDPATNQYVATPIDISQAGDQVWLILYGTGIRARGSLNVVSATVGGVNAPVTFAGAQGMNGLDQINLSLPPSLAGRGLVDVVVTVEGKVSNTVRINIR